MVAAAGLGLHAAGDGDVPPAPTVTAQMRIDAVNGGAATPISSFTLGATDTVTTAAPAAARGK